MPKADGITYEPGPGPSVAGRLPPNFAVPNPKAGPLRIVKAVFCPVVCAGLYLPGPGTREARVLAAGLCELVPNEKAGGRFFFHACPS